MSKQTKKALVPMLRFPEFRDVGEWEEKQLGKQVTLEYGAALPESQRIGGKFPVVGSNGVVGYHNRYLVEGPAIVIGRKGSVGQVNWIQSNCHPIDTTYYVRNNYPASASLEFIKLILQNCRLTELKDPSAVPGLNRNRVHSAKTAFPLPDEQQKITDCLFSIDELVTAQTQKVEALKAHKKGLMQQLFPLEGETIPKLRFPEFRGNGEWHEMPLKKVFSIFQGYAFSSNDNTKEGVRWLKIADVGIQCMDSNTPSYLPANHKEEYKKFLVKLGDYVIALTRPILSGELKMAKVDSIYDGALLNQRVGKLVTDENKDFVYCLLQTSQLINDIEKNIAGNDPPNLSSQQIGDIAVRIPKSNEQQKIADCLNTIDDLIAAQTQKLDALKTHKKGLMQQLFPAVDEVDS